MYKYYCRCASDNVLELNSATRRKAHKISKRAIRLVAALICRARLQEEAAPKSTWPRPVPYISILERASACGLLIFSYSYRGYSSMARTEVLK